METNYLIFGVSNSGVSPLFSKLDTIKAIGYPIKVRDELRERIQDILWKNSSV